jgi:hypothetical protein
MSADFHRVFSGRFTNLLTWGSLSALWDKVRARADSGWYVYAIGMPVPSMPAPAADVRKFIDAVDALLRREHDEDYCGIVYADSIENPGLIKIFDPRHLGTSCGSSHSPPLPGWVLTTLRPERLVDKRPLPANRQRWWEQLWV